MHAQPESAMVDTKSSKLKARLPRGLVDRAGAEIAATRCMMETIRKVYELYGFEPLETPAIEYTDALGKFLPDQERPNEGVFSFNDDDEQWLSLRYDLTAPLARYVAENFDALAKPYRSYRAGYVYRNEKPGPGRFRQFMQFDADTVGSASMAADAEICMMAADTMEALGIPRGSYVVKVNNRKVLDGLLDEIGLGGDANAAKRLTVLRAIDKLDRLGYDGVRQLLGPGRKDESGDFTKGAELSEQQIAAILGFAIPAESYISGNSAHNHNNGPDQPIWRVANDTGSISDDRLHSVPGLPQQMFCDIATYVNRWRKFVASSQTGNEGIEELLAINALVRSAGYGTNRIEINASVVRGLEYYTGPVYEVELNLPIVGDDGKPVRFGSVGGGGRYDGLVSRFRAEPVPATGFSIGVSRLLAALMHLGKIDAKPEPGPVIVTVLDRERIADYQRMAATLRAAGIRAELYLGAGKFGPQMKYADRRRSPCVVIQGSNEKARGEVQIKDLMVGAELAGLSKERDDYLRRQAEAQFAVREDRLVEAVRGVLARHSVPPSAGA
jgi:histidyl-tRNA synthetase